MGFVRVPVKLFAAEDGRESVEVEALVDTGAIFCLFPRSLLARLGVQPSGKRAFRAIDGRPIERDVGAVQIELEGTQPPGPVPVIFGQETDSSVVGVTALESMGLMVDPTTGTLRKTDLLLLRLSYEGDDQP